MHAVGPVNAVRAGKCAYFEASGARAGAMHAGVPLKRGEKAAARAAGFRWARGLWVGVAPRPDRPFGPDACRHRVRSRAQTRTIRRGMPGLRATRVDRPAIPGDSRRRCTAEQSACETGRCPTGSKEHPRSRRPTLARPRLGAYRRERCPWMNVRGTLQPRDEHSSSHRPVQPVAGMQQSPPLGGAMGGRCSAVGSPCLTGHGERDEPVSPVRCGPGGR